MYTAHPVLHLSLHFLNSLGSAVPVMYPQSMLMHTATFVPDLSNLELDNIPMNGKYTYVPAIKCPNAT